ncbi:MmgE/PrpD family protein [Halomarina ordinaria]|uniref:MmgE/PrpD family protein n=1 Tax=Halomarina ordinaria TaxID=3033939 RepID=A0ABD5UD86_9EURY|nr:MmgE/PrpD family protein [Halomarina sp. PSRA2]
MRSTSPRDPDGELAAFAADIDFDDLPTELVRSAERAFVDTVGVTVAGAVEGAGAVAIETTRAGGEGGPASFVGVPGSASVPDAAFANGTAGHALDFDDVTRGVWHPSVPVVAPVLALAEAEDLPGERAVTAYVAGYETQCYLADALLPEHYERGWHATATFGTIGAAVACAVLLDLDETATRRAINAAASMPAGLKKNFGTMTKPMHAGHAARSGLTAAMLAARGHTAADGALGTDRGVLDLYAGDDLHPEEMARLGEEWALASDGIQVKKYPCCYFTHPGVYATQRLVADNDLAPADVESVRVLASRGAADALHYDDPDSGLEAKFSMPYTVASAVVRDRVGLEAFDDENVGDPEVQAVRERVAFEVDPDLAYEPYHTTVVVETTAGERHERVQEVPPGTPADPLTDEELAAKFRMCVERADVDVDPDVAYRRLDALGEQDSVAHVTDAL